jgi:hypothetical protein
MRRLLLAALLCAGSFAAFAQTATKQAQIYPIAPVATACCTLTAGGTAQPFQNATNASGSGYASTQTPVACLIVNPTTANEQGIAAAEAIWYNVVGTAAVAAGGQSIPLEAGANVIVYPATNAVSWIAATTGHKIAGYCWQ